MLRPILIFSFILLSYIFYGFYISSFDFSSIKEDFREVKDRVYYDYKGVTHAHSSLSIGSKDQEFIISAAKEAQLHFLIFSEKNLFKNINRFEGYNDNLLILQANKYSYLNSELIYYGSPNKELTSIGKTQVSLTDLLSNKDNLDNETFMVLSRPKLQDESWIKKLSNGINAIEIVNLKQSFDTSIKKEKLRFLASLFLYPFNAKYSLVRLFDYPTQEVNLWNQLNQRHPTIGFLGNGTTAKAILIPKSSVTFPSYKVSFELASNHILLKSELTGNFIKDRTKILTALKRGNFYLSIDALAKPEGFFTDIIDVKGKKHLPGEKIQLTQNVSLRVFLPEKLQQPTEIIVFRNNEVYARTAANIFEMPIHQDGFYRVEVKLKVKFPFPEGYTWLPWIFSNGFYITEPSNI